MRIILTILILSLVIIAGCGEPGLPPMPDGNGTVDLGNVTHDNNITDIFDDPGDMQPPGMTP